MVKHNQTENFMSLFSRLMISAMVVLFILAWSGCCCPNKPIEKANTNKAKESGKADSFVSGKEQKKVVNGMKMAFAHPVVMVNGKRAEVTDAQKTIEVTYPINANGDITIVVLGPEGNEETLQGQVKTFEHTEHTTPEMVILVVPDDPETTYYDILRNGYGEISVCEYIQRADSVEEKGKVLFQIVLGSKKKNHQSMIEFRFREGVVEGVAPLFTLAENSHQEFIISLQNAELKAKCDLKSFKNNFYTAIAPVWIEFNESCINSLREQGEVTLALYVPSSENQIKETQIVMVDPTADIQEVTQNYGTLVGVLKLRRSNG